MRLKQCTDLGDSLHARRRGKVFYTPPGSDTTQLWNLLYSNSSVGVVVRGPCSDALTH